MSAFANNLYHQLHFSGEGRIFPPQLSQQQFRMDQPMIYSPDGLQIQSASNHAPPQRSVMSVNSVDLPIDTTRSRISPFYVIRDQVPNEYSYVILPQDNPYFWMGFVRVFIATVADPRQGMPVLLWWLKDLNIPAMLELMFHVIQKRDEINIVKSIYKVFPMPGSTIQTTYMRDSVTEKSERYGILSRIGVYAKSAASWFAAFFPGQVITASAMAAWKWSTNQGKQGLDRLDDVLSASEGMTIDPSKLLQLKDAMKHLAPSERQKYARILESSGEEKSTKDTKEQPPVTEKPIQHVVLEGTFGGVEQPYVPDFTSEENVTVINPTNTTDVTADIDPEATNNVNSTTTERDASQDISFTNYGKMLLKPAVYYGLGAGAGLGAGYAMYKGAIGIRNWMNGVGLIENLVFIGGGLSYIGYNKYKNIVEKLGIAAHRTGQVVNAGVTALKVAQGTMDGSIAQGLASAVTDAMTWKHHVITGTVVSGYLQHRFGFLPNLKEFGESALMKIGDLWGSEKMMEILNRTLGDAENLTADEIPPYLQKVYNDLENGRYANYTDSEEGKGVELGHDDLISLAIQRELNINLELSLDAKQQLKEWPVIRLTDVEMINRLKEEARLHNRSPVEFFMNFVQSPKKFPAHATYFAALKPAIMACGGFMDSPHASEINAQATIILLKHMSSNVYQIVAQSPTMANKHSQIMKLIMGSGPDSHVLSDMALANTQFGSDIYMRKWLLANDIAFTLPPEHIANKYYFAAKDLDEKLGRNSSAPNAGANIALLNGLALFAFDKFGVPVFKNGQLLQPTGFLVPTPMVISTNTVSNTLQIAIDNRFINHHEYFKQVNQPSARPYFQLIYDAFNSMKTGVPMDMSVIDPNLKTISKMFDGSADLMEESYFRDAKAQQAMGFSAVSIEDYYARMNSENPEVTAKLLNHTTNYRFHESTHNREGGWSQDAVWLNNFFSEPVYEKRYNSSVISPELDSYTQDILAEHRSERVDIILHVMKDNALADYRGLINLEFLNLHWEQPSELYRAGVTEKHRVNSEYYEYWARPQAYFNWIRMVMRNEYFDEGHWKPLTPEIRNYIQTGGFPEYNIDSWQRAAFGLDKVTGFTVNAGKEGTLVDAYHAYVVSLYTGIHLNDPTGLSSDRVYHKPGGEVNTIYRNLIKDLDVSDKSMSGRISMYIQKTLDHLKNPETQLAIAGTIGSLVLRSATTAIEKAI